MKKRMLTALCAALLAGASYASLAQTTTLVNPIMAGFYPDPTFTMLGSG